MRPVACGLVWTVCLFAFICHNNFPTFFHTDEKHKVGFVLDGVSNFQHPMLLTQTARIFNNIAANFDRAEAFKIGRSVSALFGATAVVLFMLIGWRLRGPAGGWAVGLTVGTSYFLLLLAHYMKEDAGLLMGLAAVLLALLYVVERPTRNRLLWLGVACAVATSAKYAGAVVLLPALGIALGMRPARGPGERLMRAAWVLAAFVPVLLLINLHFVLHPSEFIAGLSFEVEHVATGHHGQLPAPFGVRYLDTLENEVQWPVRIMSGLYLLLFACTWRRRTASEWLVLLFPITWFMLMSVSEIQFSRYMLPVVTGLQVLAALAALELAQRLTARMGHPALLRRLLATLLVLVVAVPQGVRAYDYLGQLKDDSRLKLAKWAAENLPATAYVLEDRYARLEAFKGEPEFRKRLQFRVLAMKWAADIGSLEEARRQGITHIAVCSMAFGRLYNPWMNPSAEERERIEARKAFYSNLFASAELVWAMQPRWPTRGNTNPRIFVYDISRPADPATGPDARPLATLTGPGESGELAEEGEYE